MPLPQGSLTESEKTMKIERLNDNQIRCILTAGEMLKRHLSLNNLAQGGQEAQSFVREMMEQSSEEFGFEPNDLPLLVELSPAEAGGISLTVTKVNSLDEIPASAKANHLLRALQAIVNMAKEKEGEVKMPVPAAIFTFDARRPLLLPPELKSDPRGVHTALYLQPKYQVFYLTVSASVKYQAAFNNVCHLLSEYGRSIPATEGSQVYFDEHYIRLFAKNALKHIANGELENALPKG